MAQAGVIVTRSIRQVVTLDRVLLGLLALALVFALGVLWLGLFQPLTDFYGHRQVQTAITTYWLRRGGPIFAYETPILGYPWSIPFEFPVYQIVVAILGSAGVPLDPAGRIVSFGFFVGCLWPLHMLFRTLRFEPIVFPCVGILFVLCPLYLYYGRTFMIETCALFFCLVWLAYFARYLTESRPVFAAVAVVAGVLGILAKSTTFPAFAVLGAVLFAKEYYPAWVGGLIARRIGPIVTALLLVVVPFIVGIVWTAYADRLKLENEIASHLTSYLLAGWTLGTWDQRIGIALWRDVIWRRSLVDGFGHAIAPAFLLIAATLLRREYAYAAGAAVLAFLVPFLVFTNLHVVHSYYQMANMIFIIAAAGLGLAQVMRIRFGALIGLVFLASIAAGQLFYFRSLYAPSLTYDYAGIQEFGIAKVVQRATQANTSLLVIGESWSAMVPYYGQRKGLAIPNFAAVSSWQRILAAPQRYLDGVPLGGVVYCTDNLPEDAERRGLIEAFVAGRAVLGEFGPCRLLAPATSSSGLSFEPRVGLAHQSAAPTSREA